MRYRVEVLSSLRNLISLPPSYDISPRQWAAIESQLAAAKARLLARLNAAGRRYLSETDNPGAARGFNAALGEIDLELTKALILFDTYADILTQRLSPALGPLLAGCDVLARDGIQREHPALAIVEDPLVYCDRGHGASTVREGIPLPDGSANPLPIIQIPYAKLYSEKYNLTSVLHEDGHEAMVRLNLLRSLPAALRAALARAGASEELQSYYGLWAFEIGPDFWSFCASGLASAGGIREILALPPSHAFRVTWTDPHPPAVLRPLINFECCRQVWGRGIWDEWEVEWKKAYRLSDLPSSASGVLIREAQAHVPTVARALLTTRFSALGGKVISDLFDLPGLAPARLEVHVARANAGSTEFRGVPPAAQLAVYRLVREQGVLDEEALDSSMKKWLIQLGQTAEFRRRRQSSNVEIKQRGQRERGERERIASGRRQ